MFQMIRILEDVFEWANLPVNIGIVVKNLFSSTSEIKISRTRYTKG